MSSIQQSPDTRAKSSPTGVRSRRSHTKSRHGCLGCKQRRKKVGNPNLISISLADICSVTRYDRNAQDVSTRTSHVNTLVCQSRGLLGHLHRRQKASTNLRASISQVQIVLFPPAPAHLASHRLTSQQHQTTPSVPTFSLTRMSRHSWISAQQNSSSSAIIFRTQRGQWPTMMRICTRCKWVFPTLHSEASRS